MERLNTSLQLILFGVAVDFWFYPRGQQFRAIGAVYVFTGPTNAHTHRVIYVGQTDDLSVRPSPQHHKWGCIIRHGATHIAVLQEEDRARRLVIEADLCKTYRPPCNDLLVSG